MNDAFVNPGVRFQMLDQLGATSDGRYVELGPPRQRALLALLLIDAGKVVSLPTIISSIWGSDPPQRVTGTLQAYVSRLRKALQGRGRAVPLVHRGHGYLLDADTDLIDAAVFEAKTRRSAEELRAGGPAAARSSAASALEMWRGTPMAELYEYEFAVLQAGHLEQVRLRALETWAEACLRLGCYEEVTVRLGEELRRNPVSERLGGRLMAAQYHSGQSAEALLTYERMRAAVADELGVDLSRELQALHGQILRQELVPAPGALIPGALIPGALIPGAERGDARSVVSAPAHLAPAVAPRGPGTAVAPAAPAAPPGQDALAAPAATPRGAPPGPEMIGREDELERVRALIERAGQGSGQVLLIVGEQGIGKTQLLQEVERTLPGSGVRVARAHCLSAPAAPVYYPWEQVIHALGDAGAAGGPASPAGGERKAEEHFACQVAICRAVLSAAEHGIVVVCLEDLHLANVHVLETLHLLAKETSRARVLVLATMREYEHCGESDPTARRAVARILQEGNASALRLSGLGEEHTGELIASVSGAKPSPGRVEQLRAASGGNPFLLLGMLSAGTGADPDDKGAIPFAVREVLHERLSAYSQQTVEVLNLCAAAGAVIRRPLLDEALAIRGLPRMMVDEVIQAGLLQPGADDPDVLCFTHGLVRDIILDGALPLTRARWHRDIAAALSRNVQPRDDTSELRRHCLAAARALGTREGVRPLLALADRAQIRCFHAEALNRLEDTVAVIDALPAGDSTLAVEIEVHKRMLWLYGLLDGYGSPRAEGALHRVRKLERTVDGIPPTSVLYTQAIVDLTAGRYAAAGETAGLLHELADYGGALLARSSAHYVDGVTLYTSGRLEDAVAKLSLGLDTADSLLTDSGAGSHDSVLLNDQGVSYRAYLAFAHLLAGNQDEAHRHRSQLLQRTQSDRYDRPWDRAFALYVDAVTAVVENEIERAGHAARAGVELATRCQLTYWHHMLAVPLGWAEVYQGMPETGLRRIRWAIDGAAANRTVLRRTIHLGLLADAQRHAGRAESARQSIAQLVREADERVEYVCYRGHWPFAPMLRDDHRNASATTVAALIPNMPRMKRALELL